MDPMTELARLLGDEADNLDFLVEMDEQTQRAILNGYHQTKTAYEEEVQRGLDRMITAFPAFLRPIARRLLTVSAE